MKDKCPIIVPVPELFGYFSPIIIIYFERALRLKYICNIGDFVVYSWSGKEFAVYRRRLHFKARLLS